MTRSHVASTASRTPPMSAAEDLMPFDVQRAWWAAMLDLRGDPDREADVLVGLEAVAPT